jgi:hypothetical protein
MKTFVTCAAIAALSGVSSGAVLVESEPNDVLGDADDLGVFTAPGGSVVLDGALVPGDVDWFSFTLADTGTLVIAALGSDDPSSTDGQFMLVDGTGTDVLEFDDDSGPGLLPAFNLVNLSAGDYFLGVSGFDDISFPDDPVADDELFDGLDSDTGDPHPEDFAYKLSVAYNVVPAPGAAMLLGMAGVAAVRRRR